MVDAVPIPLPPGAGTLPSGGWHTPCGGWHEHRPSPMTEKDTGLFELVLNGLRAGRDTDFGWEGSLREYLERVDDDPRLARNAWQRMLDMVE